MMHQNRNVQFNWFFLLSKGYQKSVFSLSIIGRMDNCVGINHPLVMISSSLSMVYHSKLSIIKSDMSTVLAPIHVWVVLVWNIVIERYVHDVRSKRRLINWIAYCSIVLFEVLHLWIADRYVRYVLSSDQQGHSKIKIKITFIIGNVNSWKADDHSLPWSWKILAFCRAEEFVEWMNHHWNAWTGKIRFEFVYEFNRHRLVI
jgi:hypothetical protein